MRNNNQAAIWKLSRQSFLANKSRNIFGIIAIVLTTVLITAVFTIGISLSDGMQEMMIRKYGRSTEVDFQYLTEDEAKAVAEHPLIEEYGLSRLITVITEGVFRQEQGEIHTADENFAKFTFSMPTTGQLPKEENEIALTSWILDVMNLPRELGKEVHLDFEVAGTPYSMDFVVSGFWDDDINLHPYGIMYISDILADKILEGVNPEETRLGKGYYGVTKMTANINGKLSQLEENVDTILADTGIDADMVGIVYNGAYHRGNMDSGIILAMALAIAIILVSGYLLIYNIFYISVMRDVRYYGLLKTVGTTQKQLMRIVNFQAFMLCIIAIPVGLIFGYLLGIVLIPVLLGFLNIDYMPAHPNLWIFLLGAALSLITVLISCHGPAKKAGKISPIEAVRYTVFAAVSPKKMKRGKKGARIYRMAWSNIFRSRKKASVVIASLSVGLVLFNIVYTVVGSFDINKFLQGYINGDFLIADTDYFNHVKPYVPSYTLNEDLLTDISKLEGVKNIARVYYGNGFTPVEGKIKDVLKEHLREELLADEPSLAEEEVEEIIEKNISDGYENKMVSQIYGFDSYWLDKLEENMLEGSFDREKFLSGKYILIGYDRDDMLQTGDMVTLSFYDKDGEKRTYEVMGKVDFRKLNSLSAHFITWPGFSAYLPSTEFEKLSNPDIMSATVIADEAAVGNLQKEIGMMLENNSEVDFRSRNNYIEELKSDNQKTALIGFTLCAVILLIGILNFVNTTITNIFSRKHELAMYESIGMTAGQSKKMLVLESLYYMVLTMFVFVTMGYGISYYSVNAVTKNSAAYTYRFSFAPFIICFPILILLACVLPINVYGSISKDTVVQRLREIE